jgi:hypothetical protein
MMLPFFHIWTQLVAAHSQLVTSLRLSSLGTYGIPKRDYITPGHGILTCMLYGCPELYLPYI